MGFEDSICNTTLTLSLGSSPARRRLAGGPRPPPSEMKFEVQEDEGGNSNSMASSFSNNSSMKRERDQIGSGGDDEVEKESPKGFSGDDDDVIVGTRKKLRLTKDQSVVLEDSFKEHSTLNSKQKDHLARRLNLRPRQVEVWFQNRRARNKLKQTEVDCELLRKCYDNLTDENRRLQRELQELKSKTPPFYMQMSAATPLTMCPSCQRTYGGSGEHSAANTSLSSIREKSPYYSSKQNGTIAF